MTFIDARELPAGRRIEADLCLVGSGAAGLSVAKEFLEGPIRVVVLESGGLELTEATQDLNRGPVVGQEYVDLGTARLRYFGGTTNHWTAHVRPFDRIDFEPRPWVPFSGWPLNLEDLRPYYEAAYRFLGLPDPPFDPEAWGGEPDRVPWQLENGGLRSVVVRIVDETYRRFGPRLRAEIERSKSVDVYLNANVLEIESNREGTTVAGLRFATEPGRNLSVKAKYYVLAAGAIENARLLLASKGGESAGLGNRRDLVGRFFGNHLEVKRVVRLHPRPGLDPGFYRLHRHDSGVGFGALRFPDETQRKRRLLQTRFQIRRPPRPKRRRRRSSDADLGGDIRNVAFDMDRLARGAEDRPRDPYLPIKLMSEQAPNPESRVTLADEVDAFGQPRAVLDWRPSELDDLSVRRNIRVLALVCGASGLGRVQDLLSEGVSIRSLDLKGSYHHTGTTRMNDEPASGVVDRNCRVHGLSNLYVASSSVFPTHGTANPTLTIIALAYRLADHLKGRLA